MLNEQSIKIPKIGTLALRIVISTIKSICLCFKQLLQVAEDLARYHSCLFLETGCLEFPYDRSGTGRSEAPYMMLVCYNQTPLSFTRAWIQLPPCEAWGIPPPC